MRGPEEAAVSSSSGDDEEVSADDDNLAQEPEADGDELVNEEAQDDAGPLEGEEPAVDGREVDDAEENRLEQQHEEGETKAEEPTAEANADDADADDEQSVHSAFDSVSDYRDCIVSPPAGVTTSKAGIAKNADGTDVVDERGDPILRWHRKASWMTNRRSGDDPPRSDNTAPFFSSYPESDFEEEDKVVLVDLLLKYTQFWELVPDDQQRAKIRMLVKHSIVNNWSFEETKAWSKKKSNKIIVKPAVMDEDGNVVEEAVWENVRVPDAMTSFDCVTRKCFYESAIYRDVEKRDPDYNPFDRFEEDDKSHVSVRELESDYWWDEDWWGSNVVLEDELGEDQYRDLDG